MSQRKRLKSNIEYLERFMLDIEKIKDNLAARGAIKSYDDACEEIFAGIRTFCQDRISKTLETGDKESAQSLQDLSNQILKLISNTRQDNWNNIERNKCQISLMEEIVQSSNASKNSLYNQIVEEDQIVEEESLETDNILLEPPPVRDDSVVDLPKAKERF